MRDVIMSITGCSPAMVTARTPTTLVWMKTERSEMQMQVSIFKKESSLKARRGFVRIGKYLLITPTAVRTPKRSGTTSSVFRYAQESNGARPKRLGMVMAWTRETRAAKGTQTRMLAM